MAHFSLQAIALGLLSLALLSDCKGGADKEQDASPAAVVEVRTTPLERGDIPVVVTASGKTGALRREAIHSPIAGKLVSLKVVPGKHVEGGEVVAAILTRESQAAQEGSEALARQASTETQKQEAAQALELSQRMRNEILVRSGLSGAVAALNANQGELVTENESLMTVIDLSTLDFLADLPLSELPRVKTGQPATLRLQSLPGTALAARVAAVDPEADPLSQTVNVRLRIEALPDSLRRSLRADMAGAARIVIGTHGNVLLAPDAALLRKDEDNSYSVVVAQGDTLARIVPVTLGVSEGGKTEIEGAGLGPGVRVIVEGGFALPDSSRIKVRP